MFATGKVVDEEVDARVDCQEQVGDLHYRDKLKQEVVDEEVDTRVDCQE